MESITSNTSTSSNVINVVRSTKSYTGEKLEDFGDWHRKAGFILSMQHPDIFAVMEGQARPTEETDQVEETAPLQTPGVLYAPGGTLLQRQAAYDRANQDMYAILYLVMDKAALFWWPCTLATSAGPVAMKEQKEKCLRVTNESIRALQAALATTSMEPDKDPDHFIMQATRLGVDSPRSMNLSPIATSPTS